MLKNIQWKKQKEHLQNTINCNMKYKVEITEILQRIIEVEASNEKEAIELVEGKYRKEEVILDDTDIKEVKIEMISIF